MGRVSSFIEEQDLPCQVWLNGSIGAAFDLSTSTFVWKNYYGTSYDFIQADTALHPAITEDGVSFSSTDRLYPRTNTLFSNVDSYSLIFITYGNGYSSENTLLTVQKSDTAKPDWLRYKYQSNQSHQQFSLVNLTNPLNLDTIAADVQTVGITHDIRHGFSRVQRDAMPVEVRLNSDRGDVLANYPGGFYLGNVTATPFSGSIRHFLAFVPSISDADMADLIQLLLLSNYSWDDLTELDWDSLEEEDWNTIE